MVVATVGAVGGGGQATRGDRLCVSGLGAGGVLASVGCTSMVKRTIGARGVFLGAALGGVAEAVAVRTLGVLVGLDGFFDFESSGKEKEEWL